MIRLACLLAPWMVFASPSLAQVETAGPLEFGTATGHPGETVDVPVFATYDYPIALLFIAFQYDASSLEFLEYDVRGSAAEGADVIGASAWRTFQPGDAIFGIFDSGTDSNSFRVPPGERQLLGKLRFLVRAVAQPGTASVKPVEKVPETAGISGMSLDVHHSRLVSYRFGDFLEGEVTVLPPSGPRPLGDFHCEQVLDRVRLTFVPSEAYSEIEIRRDGLVVATLPGSATSFTDPLPGTGRFKYSLMGRVGGKSSLEAACSVLAVSPAAPPVKELACGDSCCGGSLLWANPVSYDRISIFRDGEQIATLPGDARSFVDPDRPSALAIYTVIGELEGFRSPEVNCIDHGVWIMEIGDVQVPLEAERVVVPIYVTTSAVMRGMEFHLDIDLGRFELIRDTKAALEGTEGYPDPEFLAMGIGALHGPAAGLIYDFHPPINEGKDLPPGLHQHVLNFIFKPIGTFSNGDTFPVSFKGGVFSSPQSVTQQTDTYIPGQIRFGSGGLAPVKNLAGKVRAGDGGGAALGEEALVSLTWRNESSYERIRIERNGIQVAEIDGQATEYRDRSVPRGVFTYKVTGAGSGKTSFPASTFLSTLSPPGAFKRGDTNQDGEVGIADPIATLSFLYLGGRGPSCEDAADADDNGRIALTDAIFTLRFLFLGGVVIRAPGAAFPWFDPTPDGLTCRG